MGGYEFDFQQTEAAQLAISDIGSFAKAAKADLATVPVLPAPLAGSGIATELSTFTAAWDELCPRLALEMTALHEKANAVATVVVDVEQDNQGRFHMFSK